MTTDKQLQEVFNLADELTINYTWDKYRELTRLCNEYEILFYELDNGFGIGDYCFYYNESN